MSELKNKTLSAVVTHDSVFFMGMDKDYTLIKTGQKEIFEFIASLHSGEFVEYDIKIVNAGNKFVFSDNSKFSENEDFLVGCCKFTGQNIYVKFIQHFAELKTDNHIAALIDHYYYLTDRNVIHFHFEQDAMFVYIKQNGLFILFNIFDITNEADLLYFSNLSFEAINDEVTADNRWVISGKIDPQAQKYKTLIKYFPGFQFLELPENFEKSMTANKGYHHFLHYLNLTCAS